jgi:hypothetical protein
MRAEGLDGSDATGPCRKAATVGLCDTGRQMVSLAAEVMRMSEPVDNLLLEHLKALRNELREFRNEFHTGTENLKHRLSAIEIAMIKVKREVTAGDET